MRPSRRAPANPPTDAAESRSGADARQRLFFALWPPSPLQERLYRLGQHALADCPGRRLAAPQLHLTLVFLGSVAASRLECLRAAAADIESPPFDLQLDYFGHWRRPQVVWLGCRDVPLALQHLVTELRTRVGECGLQTDTRPYVPHLSLARKIRHLPPITDPMPISWPVKRFSLVESRSTTLGVRYDVCDGWDLVAR